MKIGSKKRIFGILPNFRSVTAGTHLPPQSVKDKLVTASEDSFDYSALLLAALVAVEQYGFSDTPEFGTGGVGYSRYLWHSFTDQTSENMLVEFIVPSLTHEDTRYYSLGRGGFAKRAGYSLSRTFITKKDSGKSTFNYGEVVGSGVSAGLSNLYYPRPERTVGNTVEKWGTSHRYRRGQLLREGILYGCLPRVVPQEHRAIGWTVSIGSCAA